MMRTLIQVFLGAIVVVLMLANFALRSDPLQRNYEVLPDMAQSVAYDSFVPNPNFRNGMTLQQPVAGTVIRGQMPMHFSASKEDAERAGRELTNPLAKDRTALARGAVVYANFCETCHGPAGKGDGTVAKRGFPAPPSLLAPRAMTMKDGQIFHVITYGQANMPSYASQVERTDRWAVVEYVRQLQGGRP